MLAFLKLDDDWKRASERVELAAAPALRQRPTWEDYEAWLRSQHSGVASRNRAPVQGLSFLNRPGDRVLQIAVSSLNRVAEKLHAAVLEWASQASQRVALREAKSRPPK
jgi:hypothetical protein